MNQREVEDLIIELLAQQGGRDPAELRRDLEELGEDLPIDSLLAAEVLTRVEELLKVSLPATAETSENLKSVSSFARAILDLIRENQRHGLESA